MNLSNIKTVALGAVLAMLIAAFAGMCVVSDDTDAAQTRTVTYAHADTTGRMQFDAVTTDYFLAYSADYSSRFSSGYIIDSIVRSVNNSKVTVTVSSSSLNGIYYLWGTVYDTKSGAGDGHIVLGTVSFSNSTSSMYNCGYMSDHIFHGTPEVPLNEIYQSASAFKGIWYVDNSTRITIHPYAIDENENYYSVTKISGGGTSLNLVNENSVLKKVTGNASTSNSVIYVTIHEWDELGEVDEYWTAVIYNVSKNSDDTETSLECEALDGGFPTHMVYGVGDRMNLYMDCECDTGNALTGSIPGIDINPGWPIRMEGTFTTAGTYTVTFDCDDGCHNTTTFIVGPESTQYVDGSSTGWNDALDLYGLKDRKILVYPAGTVLSIPSFEEDCVESAGQPFAENYTFTVNSGLNKVPLYCDSDLDGYIYFFAENEISHTVTYAANGGSGSMPDTVATDTNSGNTSVTLAANGFTKSGYTFAGWKIGNTTYQPGQTVSVGANAAVTATAQWSQNTLSASANNISGVSKLTYSNQIGASANNGADLSFAVKSCTGGTATVNESGLVTYKAPTVTSTSSYTVTVTVTATFGDGQTMSKNVSFSVTVDPVLVFTNAATSGTLSVKGA